MLSTSYRLRLICQIPAYSIRHASTQREVLSKGMLRAEGPVAEQLAATNVWKPHRSKARATVKGEKTRINVTGEKLCRKDIPRRPHSTIVSANN